MVATLLQFFVAVPTFQNSTTLTFQVTQIPVTNATAFQIHAVAHSSQSPSTLYTVKAGIQRTVVGDSGHESFRFGLLPLGEFRATPLAHCSCLAGQRMQFCKHVARLLQFCVPDFPHFGAIGDVPPPVHQAAIECERREFIHQTSSHQRKMVPRSVVDLSAELRYQPLLDFGYISPHYAWGIKNYTWSSESDATHGTTYKLVAVLPEAIED